VKIIFWIAFFCIISVNAFASNIILDINVIKNDQRPIIIGQTNLPPGTILMVTLVNPINQGGDGYLAQLTSSVQANNIVRFGPFTKDGKKLSPGVYHAMISTVMADLQPQEVRPFFGVNGERLTGALVSTLPGTSLRIVTNKYQFEIISDSSTSRSNQHTIGSPNDIWQKTQRSGRKNTEHLTNKMHEYGYYKQKFLGMGLCMACADNVAQWCLRSPNSHCGILAKHALEGSSSAVKELLTFPSYCTWDYR
jgi:hypothetical protein